MRGTVTSYLATTLGLAALAVILVGVSLGAGQAVTTDLRAELGRSDPFLFTVVATSPGTIETGKPAEGLTFEQALDLRSRLGPGAEMAMTGFERRLGEYVIDFPDGTRKTIKESVSFVNVDDAYFRLMRLPLQSGRTFTWEEVSSAAHVCIVGASRTDAGYDPTRQMNTQYTIIGQLCPVEGPAFPLPSGWWGEFPTVDSIVFTPVTEVVPLRGITITGTIIPLVRPRPDQAAATMDIVADYLRELWPGRGIDFGIGSQVTVSLVQAEEKVSTLVWYVTGSLVFLLTTSTVGLIILFLTRNRRPLALRRALGATRSGIVLSCGAAGTAVAAGGTAFGAGALAVLRPALAGVLGQDVTVPWNVVGSVAAIVVAAALVASIATGLATTAAMPGEAARRGTATSGRRSLDVRVLISLIAVTVGATTIMVLLVTGRASLSSLDQYLRGAGERTIVVRQDPFLAGSLTEQDLLGPAQAAALRDALPETWSELCVGSSRTTCQPGSPEQAVAFLYGLDRPWRPGEPGFDVATGRTLTDADMPGRASALGGSAPALVGSDLARRLFGETDPIGQTVNTAKGFPVEVVGVLKPRPNGVIDSRGDRDFSLVVPYGLLAVLSDVPLDLGATEVCLEFPPGLAPADAVEVATDALSATGLEKIGLTATAVIDEVSGLSRLRGRMSGFQLAIAYAALIAIAWMIAGTVQTRVLERRREIGLKRSLGAGQTRLGLEVLAESIGLSLGGGLVGVLAGWLLSLYFCRVEGWAAASPLVPALEVVGVLTGVACLAAIWPVKTAVGEEPMVALREGEGA